MSFCSSCHVSFWFGRRKHHCRSCGGVFCSECTTHTAPIPSEQLYHPVRICDDCFFEGEQEQQQRKQQQQQQQQSATSAPATPVASTEAEESKVKVPVRSLEVAEEPNG